MRALSATRGEIIRIQPESPKCGATLQASTSYQDLVSEIGYERKPEEADFELCYYWIESPKNTQIEVRIDGISGTYASGGCPFGGVEIKATKTLCRFCADEDEDLSLVSKTNRVPIMTFSRSGKTVIKLQYRYVTDGKPGPKPKPAVTQAAGYTFSTPPGFRCKDTMGPL
ncbi:unnamed protein product [Heligmosomoides polygyrus]|uniref:CUB domain-containing protein n=1 Tax=Heligmosomoides polygyrus TaxID=6339 RepID=A0A183GVI9_HELPZ|nr:unnamed protein product [Heligmosomoides polygyrus]